MTAPLTPEEIRRRLAVLAANPELVREYHLIRRAERFLVEPANRANRAKVTIGKVEWPQNSPPSPPRELGAVDRYLPVESHMLSERVWISEHPLGEKS